MDLTALIAFLAPLLGGFLSKTGEVAADQAADDLGTRLWGRIKRAISGNASAEQAVQDAAEHPDDEDARVALKWQLRKLLEADPALAAELEAIWTEQPASARSVTVGGSVKKATIIAGDNNTVRR